MYEEKSLPFTEEFLEAIVGHCLTNQRFFVKCHNKLKGSWFTKNILLGNVFDQLCRSYKDNDIFIKSIEEFKGEVFFLEQKDREKEIYYNLIDRCVYQASSNFSIEKIERNLTGFLRVSLFKESIEGAARRYKSEGFVDAYSWTKQKINEIQEATFEDEDLILSFAHPEIWIKEHQIRRGQAISTGNSILDAALGGGLFRKETCAFMAPPNTGKTTSMISIARHAIKNKHKVLFFIHEGFPEEIRLRLLASFLAVRMDTVYKMAEDPAMRHIVNAVTSYIDTHLKFVPYIKTNAMFIEDVIALVKKMNHEEKMKTGAGFDLFVDDYPKKLKSRLRTGSKEGLYRVEAAEVYDSFNHLATEEDMHVFVAIQTNRTGLKQNNNKQESGTLLGLEEIDESFGIAQNIANIVTLNRSPEDKKLNIMRFNVARSRNSETDIAINTRTAFGCGLTFGDKNMINNNGLWEIDIDKKILASYAQKDNQKYSTDIIHEELRKIEEASELSDSGVYVPSAKIAE
jgi:replicative DNA helicase